MKNLILFLGLLFLLNLSGYSQIMLGVKAGGNVATIHYDNSLGINHEPKPVIGYHLGLTAEKAVSQKVFIRSELFYSRKGSKSSDSHYLNVPLIVGYRLIPNLSLYFGPEVGYTLGKSRDRENNFRDYDFSLDGGMLYSLTNALALDLRYSYGLVKMGNVKSTADRDPIYDGQNRVAQLGINYMFLRK
jgi:opacity protein-like surface antigen